MRTKEKFFDLLTSEIEGQDCWSACNDGESAKATLAYLNGYAGALRDAATILEQGDEGDEDQPVRL